MITWLHKRPRGISQPKLLSSNFFNETGTSKSHGGSSFSHWDCQSDWVLSQILGQARVWFRFGLRDAYCKQDFRWFCHSKIHYMILVILCIYSSIYIYIDYITNYICFSMHIYICIYISLMQFILYLFDAGTSPSFKKNNNMGFVLISILMI